MFTLWEEGKSEAVDLGGTLELLSSFSEMAKATKQEFPRLYFVPRTGDAFMPKWYIEEVVKEAKAYLALDLPISEHTKWILETLAGIK